MRIVRLIGICLLLCLFSLSIYSQVEEEKNSTIYNVEVFGSAASGDNTPFWLMSNRYGVVPLEAGNGYLRPGIFHGQTFGKDFYWGAGMDAIVVAPRYRNVYLQQLYAEIGYKSLRLTVGSKEHYTSLWNQRLSSGDMIHSANARPVPEIHASIPEFLTVPYTKGWFHFRGYMSVGRSFDSAFLEEAFHPGVTYVKDVLWHNKGLFVRLRDTRGDFPFYLSYGLRHTAQWGGTSTNPALGKQPQSLKDLFRIFFAKAGGADATESAQINVLGAHHISYDFHAGFAREDWEVQAYYQHLSADKSGLLFYNKTDGLWGIQLDLHRVQWLRKVVVEYLDTRDQSGPLHFIWFDHEAHPGRGGGDDNYYNNGEYVTGHTYFNRAMGSPLVISPEYNEDRELGFRSTRVKDWHLGAEGDLSERLSYRALVTVMNSWGTHSAPFLKKRDGVSFLLEMKYNHPQLPGWALTGSLAGDTGDVMGKRSYGFGLGISKRGVLKHWR